MGISVHVYDSIDEYVKRNGRLVSDKSEINDASISLKDIWVTQDEKLRVVLDCEKFYERPDTSRSISCFQRNNINKYQTGDEKLVKYDDVSFDPKPKIYSFSKKIKKSTNIFKVGKFCGDMPKKTAKINWEYKFFNLKANRIDFILL